MEFCQLLTGQKVESCKSWKLTSSRGGGGRQTGHRSFRRTSKKLSNRVQKIEWSESTFSRFSSDPKKSEKNDVGGGGVRNLTNFWKFWGLDRNSENLVGNPKTGVRISCSGGGLQTRFCQKKRSQLFGVSPSHFYQKKRRGEGGYLIRDLTPKIAKTDQKKSENFTRKKLCTNSKKIAKF